MNPFTIAAIVAKGISGQIIICTKPITVATTASTATATRTNDRTTNPTQRLSKLSTRARSFASSPAPGYDIIRRHGKKSVRSKIPTENACPSVLTRRTAWLSISRQPRPYHHQSISRAIISVIVPLIAHLMVWGGLKKGCHCFVLLDSSVQACTCIQCVDRTRGAWYFGRASAWKWMPHGLRLTQSIPSYQDPASSTRVGGTRRFHPVRGFATLLPAVLGKRSKLLFGLCSSYAEPIRFISLPKIQK